MAEVMIDINDSYDVAPEDYYALRIIDIEYKSEGVYGPYLSFKFEIFNSDEKEWDGSWVFCSASSKVTPKSKLNLICKAVDPDLLGDNKKIPLKLLKVKLLGKGLRAIVEHNEKADGSVYPIAKTFKPLKKSDAKSFKKLSPVGVEKDDEDEQDEKPAKRKNKASSKQRRTTPAKKNKEKEPEPEETMDDEDGEGEESEGERLFPPIKEIKKEKVKALRALLAELDMDANDFDKDALRGVAVLFAKIYDDEDLENPDIDALKNAIKLLEMDKPKKGTSPGRVIELVAEALSERVVSVKQDMEEALDEDNGDDDDDDDDFEDGW